MIREYAGYAEGQRTGVACCQSVDRALIWVELNLVCKGLMLSGMH